MRAFLWLPLLAFVAGCSGTRADYDRAYGRPDATRWSYFEASAERVVRAVEVYAERHHARIESAEREDGGVLLTLVSRDGGPDVLLVFVERSPVERYGARAQVWPGRRPLPRDLEGFVTTWG